MNRRPTQLVLAALAVLLLVAVSGGLVGRGSAAGAETTTTTTTTEPTTTTTSTTVAPSTTTTTEPTTTTTTTTSSTTTTQPATTTTVHERGTTTSTTPAPSKTGGPPWDAIIAVIALAVAIAIGVLIALAVRRRRSLAAWMVLAGPALDNARLALGLLTPQAAAPDDPERREAVSHQVDLAVDGLQRAADAAVDAADRVPCATAAQALRDLGFAVEADRILRHGTVAPTGTQLEQADTARRERAAALEASLTALAQRIGPRDDRIPPMG